MHLKGLADKYTSRVLKIALLYRTSMVYFFFTGLGINAYTNLQKKPASSGPSNHSWFATICCDKQTLMARKHLLQLATTHGSQPHTQS